MSQAGFTWECSCGHIDYSEEAPEECPKCFSIDSFTQLPEEIALEREKEELEDADNNTISALRKIYLESHEVLQHKP